LRDLRSDTPCPTLDLCLC
jgi:hypothetical protein